jgi:tubulin epsilon
LLHSLGGGTGSGLGSYILGLLEDEFPEVFRFTASVFPSQSNDDVVTSPYNSLFSLYEIMKHADCSLPIDNQALLNIVDTVEEMASKNKGQKEVSKGS